MTLLDYHFLSNSIKILFSNIDNYNIHESEINIIVYKLEIILNIVQNALSYLQVS